MKFYTLSKYFIVGAVLWSLCSGVSAGSSKIRITFSGTFEQCSAIGALCTGTPLEPLSGTEFQGVVEYPAHGGVDSDPEDPRRGVYKFSAPAFMSMNVATNEFDLGSSSPVTLIVTDCQGVACALNQDLVEVVVEQGGYFYVLRLIAPDPPFETDALPPASVLRNLFAVVEIHNGRFDPYIGISSGSQPSPVMFNVETLPGDTAGSDASRVVPSIFILLEENESASSR